MGEQPLHLDASADASPTSAGRRPEAIAGLRPPGLWAYAHDLSLAAGDRVDLSVSSPAAYEATLVALSEEAALRSNGNDDHADRTSARVLGHRQHDRGMASVVECGSYVFVTGPPIAPGADDTALTLGAWARVWDAPEGFDLPWNHGIVLGEFDFPFACRFALVVTERMSVGLYVGDGGEFRYEWLHLTDPGVVSTGTWAHLAADVGESGLSVSVDGRRVLSESRSGPLWHRGEPGQLRIGAGAENGKTSFFLDADIAHPFLGPFAVADSELREIAMDRGRRAVSSVLDRALYGYWPLDEERGSMARDASGAGRHGRIVNGGTWQVGGPSGDPARGGPGYEPAHDLERGHSLRLARDDLLDCGWPVTDSFDVPVEAESGFYATLVSMAGQAPEDGVAVPLVVSKTRPSAEGAIALLIPTNTWHAYGRVPAYQPRIPGLTSSFYGARENGLPFYRIGLRMPIPNVDPFRPARRRAAFAGHSHLVRPERICLAWLRAQGYLVDCFTDADFDREPECLRAFSALVICGHNEYWTDRMRSGLEAYLEGNGKVLNLSGNTLYWRVSLDADPPALEARKATYADENDAWLPPEKWAERWHSSDGRPGGRWQLVGQPGRELLGLDTQGWSDDGSPASFSPYEVLAPEHPLFHSPEVVPLAAGGLIGTNGINGPRASGYEVDATPAALGLDVHNPPELVVLARARQRMAETIGVDRDLGAELIYWDRPAGGTVVNAGSIAFSGTLPVDAATQAFVRNVLAAFGVERRNMQQTGPSIVL